MQLDMHYYGTYFLARMAGLPPEIVKQIAISAEFVDDNTDVGEIETEDGGRISGHRTSHHIKSAKGIVPASKTSDQIRVWIPFHFFPGGKGGTISERLLCEQDSDAVRETFTHYIRAFASEPFSPFLIGVMSHVYADTFAHYGFSGVSSRRNTLSGLPEIDPACEEKINTEWKGEDDQPSEFVSGAVSGINYVLGKLRKHEERNRAPGAQNLMEMAPADNFARGSRSSVGSLGHAWVGTFPDRPYLKWHYRMKYPSLRRGGAVEIVDIDIDTGRVVRDNPKTYRQACRALYGFLCEYRRQLGGATRQTTAVEDGSIYDALLKERVGSIIDTPGTKSARANLWREAARELFGSSGSIAPGSETTAPKTRDEEEHGIPPYPGEDGGNEDKGWNPDRERIKADAEKSGSRGAKFIEEPLVRFYQAAEIHRTHTLRTVLPRLSIILWPGQG